MLWYAVAWGVLKILGTNKEKQETQSKGGIFSCEQQLGPRRVEAVPLLQYDRYVFGIATRIKPAQSMVHTIESLVREENPSQSIEVL